MFNLWSLHAISQAALRILIIYAVPDLMVINIWNRLFKAVCYAMMNKLFFQSSDFRLFSFIIVQEILEETFLLDGIISVEFIC